MGMKEHICMQACRMAWKVKSCLKVLLVSKPMVFLLVVGIERVFEGMKNNCGSKINGGKSCKINLKEKGIGCVIASWLIIKAKNS